MVFRAGWRDPCMHAGHEPQASVFLRFPKVEQHPQSIDHAMLHGNFLPFSNCFNKITTIKRRLTLIHILVSFCNFVFLCIKEKTKKLQAFKVRYACKKALHANKI